MCYGIGKKPEGALFQYDAMCHHCMYCCYEFDIKRESLDLYSILPLKVKCLKV